MIPLGFFIGKHDNVYNNQQVAIEYCLVTIQKNSMNPGKCLHTLNGIFLK